MNASQFARAVAMAESGDVTYLRYEGERPIIDLEIFEGAVTLAESGDVTYLRWDEKELASCKKIARTKFEIHGDPGQATTYSSHGDLTDGLQLGFAHTQ